MDVGETLGRGHVLEISNLFILGPFVLDACYGSPLRCVSVIGKGIVIVARCWKMKRMIQRERKSKIYIHS